MKTGRYNHFKGKPYEVLGVAMHSETCEKMIVYRALYDCPEIEAEYGQYPLFVRPYDMFNETVEHDGKVVSRFAYMGDM